MGYGQATMSDMGDELQLSAARREELVRLLDDPERLKTEYPLLARYMDAAPYLAGTGNDEVDAAFELRFLHFMSAVEGSKDPYWSIVGPLVSEVDGRRVLNGGNPSGSVRLAYAQTVLQDAFAYAVTSPESIQWIHERAQGKKILEAGAGRGYWASRLAYAGMEVHAFDVEPPNTTGNLSFTSTGKQPEVWHQVQRASRLSEVSVDNHETVLLLCWPPGWEDPMSSEVLQEFEQSGGQSVIYLGEPKGGKTGNAQFFSALSANWHLESVDPGYVSWWNLNDRAEFWTRKL
jgi:hypothetical protein